MHKIALAVSTVALSALTSAAYATPWIPVTSNLTGDLVVSGFGGPADGSFMVTGSNLLGSVSIPVPPSGATTVYVKGDLAITPPTPTGFPSLPAFNIPSSGVSALFSGMISHGLSAGLYSATFPGQPAVGPNPFSLSYDGSTTQGIIDAINNTFGTSLGNVSGSGTLAGTYTISNDGFILDIDETVDNNSWMGFETLFKTVENLYVTGLNVQIAQYNQIPNLPDVALQVANGQISGEFELRNASVKFVPEPGSLALLGLGLTSLALAGLRRRRVAA